MKVKVLILSLLMLGAGSDSAQLLTGASFAKYDLDKYDGKADHKQNLHTIHIKLLI